MRFTFLKDRRTWVAYVRMDSGRDYPTSPMDWASFDRDSLAFVESEANCIEN